jgi:hypothetical protein
MYLGDRVADDKPLALSWALQTALYVSIAGILFIGIYPQPLIQQAKKAARGSVSFVSAYSVLAPLAMFCIQSIALVVFMYLYYFLAAVATWFGIQSLLSGFRYVAYVTEETSKPIPDFHPFVSVIAPSRGLEDGLAGKSSDSLSRITRLTNCYLFSIETTIRRLRY